MKVAQRPTSYPSVKLTIDEVVHVARLANLILTKSQQEKFLPQLLSVLGYMSKIQKAKTADVVETAQVTGLENVYREDTVDVDRMLNQEEALSNAKKKHNGFFVVDAIFD